MARGGKREGAGRKQGQATKLNEDARRMAAAGGVLPLDYMLGVLRDPKAEEKRRDWAAKEAAPYLHARLASTEVKGEGGGPLKVEIVRFNDPPAK